MEKYWNMSSESVKRMPPRRIWSSDSLLTARSALTALAQSGHGSRCTHTSVHNPKRMGAVEEGLPEAMEMYLTPGNGRVLYSPWERTILMHGHCSACTLQDPTDKVSWAGSMVRRWSNVLARCGASGRPSSSGNRGLSTTRRTGGARSATSSGESLPRRFCPVVSSTALTAVFDPPTATVLVVKLVSWRESRACTFCRRFAPVRFRVLCFFGGVLVGRSVFLTGVF